MTLILDIAAGIVLGCLALYALAILVLGLIPDLWETHIYKRDWRRRTGHSPW